MTTVFPRDPDALDIKTADDVSDLERLRAVFPIDPLIPLSLSAFLELDRDVSTLPTHLLKAVEFAHRVAVQCDAAGRFEAGADHLRRWVDFSHGLPVHTIDGAPWGERFGLREAIESMWRGEVYLDPSLYERLAARLDAEGAGE